MRDALGSRLSPAAARHHPALPDLGAHGVPHEAHSTNTPLIQSIDRAILDQIARPDSRKAVNSNDA
ncbi:hypothetical protein [Corynebacterium glyciniphilum]|uniref:hypothetical protein n=1 Tax=Corynebacterium glyciniphilum TaxID=1404244 RepID=UPI003DA000B7